LIIWNPGPSVDLTEMTQFGPWIYFHLIIRLRKRMGTGLTVLKYSIDLMILPFSSGINNIPNASLALNCQIASLQDSQSLNEKNIKERVDVQLRSGRSGCSCYMDSPPA
jgi:hypothetical protein